MERIKVKAEKREIGKKGVNRRLRKDGLIPAILYGAGQENKALSLHSKEFTTSLKKSPGGTNVLIDLDLGEGQEPLIVLLKSFQTDILTRKLSHLDLLKINLSEKLATRVPLKIVGKSVGVVKGGLVEQSRREIEIRCLPDRIPSFIEVDISALDLGHSIHANEVVLPEGIELAHADADFSVVSIVAPKEEVEVKPAEVATVEGEVKPAEAGATPAPAGTDKQAEKQKPAEKQKANEGDKKGK